MPQDNRSVYWSTPIRDKCPMCLEKFCMRVQNHLFNVETLSHEKVDSFYICEKCGFEFPTRRS